MTSYLLDTNAWLRLVLAPEELSERTHLLLTKPANVPLTLSAISVFEISLKVRKGKIDLRLPLDLWLRRALRRSLITVIAVDAEIARCANTLPEPFHEDPADRLIVVTARVRGLTLVTSDGNIVRYSHVDSFDTR